MQHVYDVFNFKGISASSTVLVESTHGFPVYAKVASMYSTTKPSTEDSVFLDVYYLKTPDAPLNFCNGKVLEMWDTDELGSGIPFKKVIEKKVVSVAIDDPNDLNTEYFMDEFESDLKKGPIIYRRYFYTIMECEEVEDNHYPKETTQGGFLYPTCEPSAWLHWDNYEPAMIRHMKGSKGSGWDVLGTQFLIYIKAKTFEPLCRAGVTASSPEQIDERQSQLWVDIIKGKTLNAKQLQEFHGSTEAPDYILSTVKKINSFKDMNYPGPVVAYFLSDIIPPLTDAVYNGFRGAKASTATKPRDAEKPEEVEEQQDVEVISETGSVTDTEVETVADAQSIAEEMEAVINKRVKAIQLGMASDDDDTASSLSDEDWNGDSSSDSGVECEGGSDASSESTFDDDDDNIDTTDTESTCSTTSSSSSEKKAPKQKKAKIVIEDD